MMQKLIQDVQSFPPTPKEMKEFAARFSKEEWAKLCREPKFIEMFIENLHGVALLSEKILAGKAI